MIRRRAILAVLLCICLLCGCQTAEIAGTSHGVESSSASSPLPLSEKIHEVPRRSASIEMLVQHYDDYGNIIEIPQIRAGESQAAEEINQKIQEFAAEYTEYIGGEFGADRWCVIQAYPFMNDRYVQIVMTRYFAPIYSTDGDAIGFVYDIERDAIINAQAALAAGNTSQPELEEALRNWGSAYNEFDPDDVQEVELKAFVFADAGMRYVLEVTTGNPTRQSWKSIYAYHSESGKFYRCNPLFDPQEVLLMTPPLQCNEAEIPSPIGIWECKVYQSDEVRARLTLSPDGSCELHIVDGDVSTTGSWSSYSTQLDIELEGIGAACGNVYSIGLYIGEPFYYFERVTGDGISPRG